MDYRIQQALDGEIAREQLTRDEARELAETEALIGNVLKSVPVQPFDDLGRSVLARLNEAEPEPVRGNWLLRPKRISFTWRPAYGLAAAAVVALLLINREPRRPDITASAGTDVHQVYMQFRLEAPAAQQVSLAGDFTDWKPSYEMRRSNGGVWTIVVPLRPGVHDYAFIVDGERWVPDPTAPAVEDGFGGMNSRLAVMTPDRTL